MANKTNANHEGWNRNTELGCDVKTILRSDRKMKVGKTYRGVLTRDCDRVVDDILYLTTRSSRRCLPPTASETRASLRAATSRLPAAKTAR